MPTAPLLRLADAIVTDLAAQDWSQSFAPRRVYLPLVDLEDLDELVCHVVPARQSDVSHDRTRDQTDYQVDLVFAKRTDDDQTANDALLDLLDEVYRHFRRTVNSDPHAVCVGREVLKTAPAGYHLDDQDQRRQFTGVVRLLWRAFR